MRPLVDDGRVDGFDSAQLASDSEHEHHEEEENRPDLRHRHVQHRFWVRHEGQRRAGLHHITDRHVHALRQESEHGEHDEAGKHGSEEVGDRDVKRVDVAVVVELQRREMGKKLLKFIN